MSDYVKDPVFDKAFWDKYLELLKDDAAELDAINATLPADKYNYTMFNQSWDGPGYYKEYIKPIAPDYMNDDQIITRYYFIQKFELMLYGCLHIFHNWLKTKNGNSRKQLCWINSNSGTDGESSHYYIRSMAADRFTNPDFVSSFDIEIVLPTTRWLLSQEIKELANQNFELEVYDRNGNTKVMTTMYDLGQVLKKIVKY